MGIGVTTVVLIWRYGTVLHTLWEVPRILCGTRVPRCISESPSWRGDMRHIETSEGEDFTVQDGLVDRVSAMDGPWLPWEVGWRIHRKSIISSVLNCEIFIVTINTPTTKGSLCFSRTSGAKRTKWYWRTRVKRWGVRMGVSPPVFFSDSDVPPFNSDWRNSFWFFWSRGRFETTVVCLKYLENWKVSSGYWRTHFTLSYVTLSPSEIGSRRVP